MSNSVDPDETANVSSKSMLFVQKPIVIACGSKRVNVHQTDSKNKSNLESKSTVPIGSKDSP